MEKMNKYTTLGVGGYADVTVVRDETQLSGLCAATVIGRGSKILVGDGGIAGKVAVMRTNAVKIEGNRVTADGGTFLPMLAKAAAECGLSGLEWACGIPGSVGGAVIMNAGAFGGSFGEVLESVMVYGIGEVLRQNLNMGYRCCDGLPYGAITRATLRLCYDDRSAIYARMKKYADARAASQPTGRSAGSTFVGGEKSAGYYLDVCGMKGKREGGAEVSTLHANFIVNIGGATASDVLALIREGESRVEKRFDVKLKKEIIPIGVFE